MPTTPSLILQLQSNPLFLSGAREMVSNVARRLGFAEEACSQMALAVDEALCNVIRHGYDKAADKPIHSRTAVFTDPTLKLVLA